MKMMKRVFSLLLFFVAAMSVQTVQAQTNGDVNGDGKVDEQDITAIIQIMQEAGGVKEPTKYYWYAGWTIPTAENIATIVNETYPASKTSTTMNPAGKTANSTDGVIMDYNAANIYNKATNVQYYVVVPNGQGIYDSLGTKLHLDDAAFTIYSSTAIANHTIYVSSSTSRIIDVIIKK
jgi:hypothetical protein